VLDSKKKRLIVLVFWLPVIFTVISNLMSWRTFGDYDPIAFVVALAIGCIPLRFLNMSIEELAGGDQADSADGSED
jgi:hypothetical protein